MRILFVFECALFCCGVGRGAEGKLGEEGMSLSTDDFFFVVCKNL